MLNEIRDALVALQEEKSETFGSVVMYGHVNGKECPELWNYIVFNRTDIKTAGTSRMDFSEYFEVHLVHEDFVPEEAVYELMRKLEAVKGLKKSNDDIIFNYATKKNTSTVVEVATITFVHPVKGYEKRL